MKPFQWMSVMIIAALVVAGSALAQGQGQGKGKGKGQQHGQNLKQADTNNDGKVSFDEWKAARPNGTQERFNTLDTNKDGFLTKEDRQGGPKGPQGPQGPQAQSGQQGKPGPKGEGAQAQSGKQGKPGPKGDGGQNRAAALKKADTNNDGKVTFEEWKVVRPKCTQERFNAMDTDKDGSLTKADRPPRPALDQKGPKTADAPKPEAEKTSK